MAENLKYYDLIIEKIKAHHKYNGLESILDDIANDVYEHAKVIINTVSNEEVIDAYFDKVVSTSIITVPKKLNINTRAERPKFVLPETIVETIEELEEEEEENNTFIEAPEENIEQIEDNLIEDVQDEVHIEDDEVLDEACDIIEPVEDEALEEVTDEELIENDEVLDETCDTIESSEDSVDECITEDLPNNSEENIDTPLSVDQTLVEKMINGTSTNTNKDNSDELSTKNSVEVAQDIEDNAIEDSLVIDNSENDDEILELFDTDLETIDAVETLEELIEDNEPEVVERLDEVETTEDTELKEDEEVFDEIVENNIENNDFSLPDYSCFSSKDLEISFDENFVVEAFTEIQKNYIDISVKDICLLKFNNKKSISEISNTINADIETVLNVLNDVAEYLKD